MKPLSSPVYRDHIPFLARLKYRLMLYIIKLGLVFAKRFRLLESKDRDGKPTYTKTYPPLPSHEARIFIPKSHKSGDPPLPLIIDIHGGGFCIGAPVFDDRDNAILSQQHGFCVVSIPYRLGPEVKHPGAVYDVANMITAVLADTTLPVDFSRVVLAGYSAGGNLALAVNQLPLIKGKIAAVVAYYPSTNNAEPVVERRKRMTPHPQGKDKLKHMVGMFNYGYLESGSNKADPLYSPIFARREDLPAKICIVGCQYDMLCPEARDMAEDLAEHESEHERKPLSDGRNGWSRGTIRWELIEGTEHGFNQIPARGAAAEVARIKTVAMHDGVAEWLKTKVFTS